MLPSMHVELSFVEDSSWQVSMTYQISTSRAYGSPQLFERHLSVLVTRWEVVLQGGMGSLRPASLRDCQVACEMAQPACTSLSYNAVMAACFLKRGGGRATCISPTTFCTEQA